MRAASVNVVRYDTSGTVQSRTYITRFGPHSLRTAAPTVWNKFENTWFLTALVAELKAVLFARAYSSGQPLRTLV